jgi:haloacetate dehalogenase
MPHPPTWFEGFDARRIPVDGIEIAAHVGGRSDRPPLVLLHGFPQTHAMWHRVAQRLHDDFFLILPDLRGYGDSGKPPGGADHAAYSKRRMAADVIAVADALDIGRFNLCGHDRGGRVAHRLALDHADRVERLCVIDIAPTLDMYERTDMAFASAYYHWFHLIQPEPLPEKMIGGDPVEYLHTKLGRWGGQGLRHIEPAAMAEYERCFCTPEGIHGACEDYRASAGIDLELDRASRAGGQHLACDMLVLWGERGVVNRLFRPLELWQACCTGRVEGRTMPAGHYIPEELPEDTAEALRQFFSQ